MGCGSGSAACASAQRRPNRASHADRPHVSVPSHGRSVIALPPSRRAQELQRAFRAIGLEKRKGEKYELDAKTFKSFDTNGDGKVSLAEFNANLHPKTRKVLESKLNAGWVFDEKLWAASVERHAKINMAKWNIYGMLMPGTIASYKASDGVEYIVTANEGDDKE